MKDEIPPRVNCVSSGLGDQPRTMSLKLTVGASHEAVESKSSSDDLHDDCD